MSETLIGKFVNNNFSFPGGFAIQADKPIDDRLVVHSVASLTAANTFVSSTDNCQKAYNGMVVSVLETNEIYILKDVANITNINSWEKVNVPQASSADLGKLLTVEKVNIGTTESPIYKYEGRWVVAPNGLPTINSQTDRGKVLTISADGTKAEWKTNDHPNELPNVKTNELKFLQVGENGVVRWADVDALPPVLDELKNNSFLGNDELGETLWRAYQYRGTYDELMTIANQGQLVPGGTYIMKDYATQQTPINDIYASTFDAFLNYCFSQEGSNATYSKYYKLLKRMHGDVEGSFVDIVLRADSTNSFERKAKMITKSKDVFSQFAYDEFYHSGILSESETNSLVNTLYSSVPKATADIEIELDPAKLEINELLVYGIGSMTGTIYPGFKGLIKYMKDSFGNEMPFDFKTVLVGTENPSYVFADGYSPINDAVTYISTRNLSNTGKMRDVRYIIDDDFYQMLGKYCDTQSISIYQFCGIKYHYNFNQVANIGAFNSGSHALINNVEIHNNRFQIKDTLINGLKIFNDDKSIIINITQHIDDILQIPGISMINVMNSSLALNNVTIKNSAHFIDSLSDSGINTFTFPTDLTTGKMTKTEIRKILRNITIDLPNNFDRYKLLMNSEYLSNYDVMPGDYPSICVYDHLIDISTQMAELIKAKSDLLESTSEAYENDLHKPGGHNSYKENLIQKITDPTYVSLMAPLSFGEFLEFKYATTDTSGGESPVFCLLNLLRDAEKIYRIVADPNKGFVFKLQVPQFDDTPSTSVVELGL